MGSTRRLLTPNGHRGGIADVVHKVFDRLVFEKVRAGLGGRVRMAYCGSAALSPEVIDFFDDVGIPIYEGYGLTETSPTVSANHIGERRAGSVGNVLAGVRVGIDLVEGDDPRVGDLRRRSRAGVRDGAGFSNRASTEPPSVGLAGFEPATS